MMMFVESIVNTVILFPILIIIIIIMLVLFYFQSLLRRFIKRDVQVDVSPVKLVKLDVTDQKLWVSPKQVDIGMGATAALKVIFILDYFINVLYELQSHLTSEVFMLKN